MDVSIALELHEGIGPETVVAFAREAERHHYRGVFVADHLSPISGRCGIQALDAWLTLGMLASATRHVRLGTLVTPVTFRPPAIVAKLANTLDAVSCGRAEIGIGLGWNPIEHREHGLEFPDRAVRVRMLECLLRLLRNQRAEPVDPPVRHQRRAPIPLIVGGMPGSHDLEKIAVHTGAGYALGKATSAQVARCRRSLDELRDTFAPGESAVPLSIVMRLCVGRTATEVRSALAVISREVRPPSSGTGAWLFGNSAAVQRTLALYRGAGATEIVLACEHGLQVPMLEPVVRAAAALPPAGHGIRSEL